jgi:Tol biopolymer transport system component
MEPDGSNQQLLFDDPDSYDVAPDMSPDGAFVAFTQCDPVTFQQCSISRIRSDGTDFTAITPRNPDPDVNDLEPVYSPDGGSIVFGSTTRGGLIDAQYFMNPDGSNIRAFTPPADGAARAAWAPDGQRLAYQTGFVYSGAPPCIGDTVNMSIRLDGKDEKQLTGSPGFSDGFPSYSPAGDALVFTRTDSQGQSSIYVLDLNHPGAVPSLIHQTAARRAPRSLELRGGPKSEGRRAPNPIEIGGSWPRWGTAP